MRVEYTNDILLNIMEAVVANSLGVGDTEHCVIVQESDEKNTYVNFTIVMPKNEDARDFKIETGDHTEINLEGF